MIADLLTNDFERLDFIKSQYPETLRKRVKGLGDSYLYEKPGVTRDGLRF